MNHLPPETRRGPPPHFPDGEVAFDARYVTAEPSGIGQMCLQLLRDLAFLPERPTLKVLVNHKTLCPAELRRQPNLVFCEAPWNPHGLDNQIFLPRLLRRLGVRALYSVDCFAPLLTRDVAHLVTVHDLIPLVCDGLKGKKSRLRVLWRAWLALQCARAHQVVTVSEHSRSDLLRVLGIPAEKVRVLPNPVRRWDRIEPVYRFRQRWGLRGRVLSYVGRQEPYKNLISLIRAMPTILGGLGESDLRLVVAGRSDPRYPEAVEEARRLKLGDSVVFTGYLSEPSLGALYRASDVFVFPSLHEGFGLPPLEAMSFGTPVVSAYYGAAGKSWGTPLSMLKPVSRRRSPPGSCASCGSRHWPGGWGARASSRHAAIPAPSPRVCTSKCTSPWSVPRASTSPPRPARPWSVLATTA